MKRIILLTIATCGLLNAGLFDFLGDKEEVKKEEVIVEKCRVTEKVLHTENEGGLFSNITVTGTTSCDSGTLQYRFSCNGTLVSIEAGNSYDGVFKTTFYQKNCLNLNAEVTVK